MRKQLHDRVTWSAAVALPLSMSVSALVAMLASAALADAEPRERALTHQVVVSASRAEVWKTLTTTDGVTTFFAPNARVELRQGGAYEMYWDMSAKPGTRGSEGCKILSFVPDEMLSFTWNAPPKFPEVRRQRTYVVIQLSDGEKGQTNVRLTNGGYKTGGQWDEAYDYFDQAWPAVLGNLRERFKSGPRWPASKARSVPPNKTQRYVYFLRPLREGLIDAPTEVEVAAITKHFHYLQDLLATNRLILAGRAGGEAQFPKSIDDSSALDLPAPGIVVFEAESPEAARSVLQNDPAVAAGVFKGCVNPFGLALQRP